MPGHSKLLPHPLFSLLLLLLWLLLSNSAAPGQLLLGGVLGLLIPLFTRRFWPDTLRVAKPALLFLFAGRVLKDIVVANFVVARVVLGPASAVRPVFVPVPLDIRGDFPITVLASVVSLTPGTLSADLDLDHATLWVHALSEEHPKQLVRQIKHRYETPIREIFGC